MGVCGSLSRRASEGGREGGREGEGRESLYYLCWCVTVSSSEAGCLWFLEKARLRERDGGEREGGSVSLLLVLVCDCE